MKICQRIITVLNELRRTKMKTTCIFIIRRRSADVDITLKKKTEKRRKRKSWGYEYTKFQNWLSASPPRSIESPVCFIVDGWKFQSSTFLSHIWLQKNNSFVERSIAGRPKKIWISTARVVHSHSDQLVEESKVIKGYLSVGNLKREKTNCVQETHLMR